jgi:hypothetical protein
VYHPTPFETWSGRKPDTSNIRIFGSRAFVRCPNVKKLDARCLEGAFYGVSNTQKASRIYVTSPSPRIIVSYDVKIDETVMYSTTKKHNGPQWTEPTRRTEPIICDPTDNAVEADQKLTTTAQPSNYDPVNKAIQVDQVFPEEMNHLEIMSEAVPHRDEPIPMTSFKKRQYKIPST